MVQDELTTREQAIDHKLIYAAGRLVADSLNLLVEEVHVARLIIL